MSLKFTLKNSVDIPLEVDSIHLETVCDQSSDEIRATPIQQGNRQVPFGDFFTVEGEGSDREVIWRGDCSKVKLIGSHLTDGFIRVEGNAGMHLGAEMSGGEILVEGDAADWVGAEMHGGQIRICGNAGHLVGAGYRGARRGMTGGEILIDGNVGNEIGHTMRRGLIAVGGNAGDAIGFNMIAGTILVFGSAGIRHGAGMTRGTIGILGGDQRPDILPTFRFAGCRQHGFLKLYFDHLAKIGFPFDSRLIESSLDHYSGDFLESGKGELLTNTFGD